MLTLAMQREWQTSCCAAYNNVARWRKVSDDAIAFAGRGRGAGALKVPKSRRPLYLNKSYGLPKRTRSRRRPAPSWGDHGLL